MDEAALHAKEKVADVGRHRAATAPRTSATGPARRPPSLTERARTRDHRAKDRTRYQARRAQTRLLADDGREPLAVGVATLALGVLAGLTHPVHPAGGRAHGRDARPSGGRTEEVGREALDKGKQVARTAVDTLKEEAENQGLTPRARGEGPAGRPRTKETVKEEVKRQDLPWRRQAGNRRSGNTRSREPELARR